MTIHVKAEIMGYKDKDMIGGVFFYDTDGNLVEASSQATSDFIAPNGLLRARVDLTPGFDDTVYDDLSYWVPYNAFPLGLSGDVSFFAEADIFDGVDWISPSARMELILQYGDSSSSSSSSSSSTTQSSTGGGITASCPDFTITNGVEVIVRQMRPGFTYTATAIGLDGFDPVLIVRDTTNTNDVICNDDAPDAAKYQVSLPSSGNVPASDNSAQLLFSHHNAGMTDISLIVGDYNGNAGQFVLVLEGMAVTAADGAGDPFTVELNPSVVGSNVPLSVYMIGMELQLDPMMHLLDGNNNYWTDSNNVRINCDDGGTDTCWGQSTNLSSAQIRRGSSGTISGDSADAMLDLALESIAPQPMTFLMNSYQGSSTGLYAIAFHMGLS